MVPGPLEHQEHEGNADPDRSQRDHSPRRPRQVVDQDIDPEVGVFLDLMGCAKEDRPTEQEDREFQCPRGCFR